MSVHPSILFRCWGVSSQLDVKSLDHKVAQGFIAQHLDLENRGTDDERDQEA